MSRPIYIIGASVPPGNRIRHFFDSGPDGGSFLLMNIDRFRSGSFDVAIPTSPQEGPDNSLEMEWPDRKSLRLYQDGTLLFRVAADQEFLGWGAEPHEFARWPRINPVPAVEVNTSFVHFYARVLDRLKQPPKAVSVRLKIENGIVNGKRIFLTEYYAAGVQNVARPREFRLRADPCEDELSIAPEEFLTSPNRAAYRLVHAFTDFFDLEEKDIPFKKPGEAGMEIDLQAIKDLR